MLDNFGVVQPALFRCAQPNVRGLIDLAELGVTYIVKLTTEEEFPYATEAFNFKGHVEQRECSVFQPTMAQYALTAELIQDRLRVGDRIAVHCHHGRDRTGGVIGAWRLMYYHWTMDQVQVERAEFGANWMVNLADARIVAVLQEIAKEKKQWT